MRMVLKIDIKAYSEKTICQVFLLVFFLAMLYTKCTPSADAHAAFSQGKHEKNISAAQNGLHIPGRLVMETSLAFAVIGVRSPMAFKTLKFLDFFRFNRRFLLPFKGQIVLRGLK
jgi:hypothetical protein